MPVQIDSRLHCKMCQCTVTVYVILTVRLLHYHHIGTCTYFISQHARNPVSATHTHPFNGPFPRLPGWAGTRKVKTIWILLKQETVSGSGISWVICKSASRSRQITMPVPHHSFFTGRMAFLPPNQQRQSTEGKKSDISYYRRNCTTEMQIIRVTMSLWAPPGIAGAANG